mgnify:CR=1 FL=1
MEALFAAGAFAALLYIMLTVVVLAAWVHALILAFRANIFLGILCLLVQVPLVLIGVIYWIFGFDIPAALVRALRS